MKIVPLTNNNGKTVANHFIIYTPEATYFQSYKSIIIKTSFEDGKRIIYLDSDTWDYSKTTSKYRNFYLGTTTKEIKEKIASGEIRLVNLNDSLNETY